MVNLKLLWVGPEKLSFNCWLVPGETMTLDAYPGYVYRLQSGSNEKSRAIYRVSRLGHHLVAISEADLAERDKLYEWTKEGYVVVQVDGLGTNWRSKRFQDVCYKNLRDSGLSDHALWMKEAAITRPWMDLSRVSVVGSLAGGMNAVAALLHHGDVYKAVAADCGPHDGRLGNFRWHEQWLGYPVDDSYEENSNITHVPKLHQGGHLMLVVGGQDKTVHPEATLRLAKRLQQEGKEHQLVVIPNGGHCCGLEGRGLEQVKTFFRQYL